MENADVFISLQNEQKLTIAEMRKMVDEDPTIDLREKIKGGKLQIQWPHTRPEPTGEVRAKLIHDRMHKKVADNFSFREPGKSDSLNNLAGIFTLLITIPCVAYSLNMILRWMGYSNSTAKIGAIIGGLLSFFVEMALVVIDLWKKEKQMEYLKKHLEKKAHVD